MKTERFTLKTNGPHYVSAKYICKCNTRACKPFPVSRRAFMFIYVYFVPYRVRILEFCIRDRKDFNVPRFSFSLPLLSLFFFFRSQVIRSCHVIRAGRRGPSSPPPPFSINILQSPRYTMSRLHHPALRTNTRLCHLGTRLSRLSRISVAYRRAHCPLFIIASKAAAV